MTLYDTQLLFLRSTIELNLRRESQPSSSRSSIWFPTSVLESNNPAYSQQYLGLSPIVYSFGKAMPSGILLHCPVFSSNTFFDSAQAALIISAWCSERGLMHASYFSGNTTRPPTSLSCLGSLGLPVAPSMTGVTLNPHISLAIPRRRLRSATCMPRFRQHLPDVTLNEDGEGSP